ncbi:adenylyltransferase and sulfurtransferase MOCS3 [Chloroflexota bacterium]|nr:adenylyltransferase and sulfurtransferase MOCS3 [Chloroflexota bacterium]
MIRISSAVDPATLVLSNEEIRRYSRHLIMPEVTLTGQQRLKAASVLCIGTAGWVRQWLCIWQPPAWGASGWWITTSSSRTTCSAR